MKKLVCILLALLMLCGCTDNFEEEPNISDDKQQPEKVEATVVKGFTVSEGFNFIKLEDDISAKFFLDSENYIFAYCYDGFLKIYSTENGNLVYSEDYSSFGNAMRMEEYSLRKGFDYRLCFGDRIIYLSFEDFSKNEEFLFPNGIDYEINYSFEENGYYDFNETDFVYSDENGIILKSDSYEKTIVENSSFSSVNDFMDKTDFELLYDIQSPVYFDDPRFICGGTKIVIGVLSEWDAAYVGCAIYDIETEKFENYIYCNMPQSPVYPIRDRYINIPGDRLFDIAGGTSAGIEHGNSGYESYDYQTFVTYDFETAGYPELYEIFKAFVFELETKEKEPLLTLNDGFTLEIEGITENLFIIDVSSQAENGVYAIRYKK